MEVDEETFSIPCEFCDMDIPATEYTSHIAACSSRFQALIQFVDQEEGGIYRINIPNIIVQMITMRAAGSNVLGDDDSFLGQDVSLSNQLPTLIYLPPESIDMEDYEFNSLIAERIGNVRIGIRDVSTVSTEVEACSINVDDICPICRESMVEKNLPCLKTLCSHLFCKQCLTTWLSSNKKCPICVSDLMELIPNHIDEEN